MSSSLSRRDFLKLAGLLSMSYAMPKSLHSSLPGAESTPNILLILFDAWSAANLSLYGYPRRTTPNLERLAEKAIVYHNHHAGGHFTTPGTASLLTGTTPWTHQAFNFNGNVTERLLERNLFRTFEAYHRLAYTHNPLANTLLRQFMADINDFTSWEQLYLENDPLINSLFQKDYDVAAIGWNRALKRLDEGYAYSLYVSQFYETYKRKRVEKLLPSYPRGVPNYDGLAFFTLEEAIDWVSSVIGVAPQPFLGYFHFLPPHDPYHTHIDHYDAFNSDGYHPASKSAHPLRGEYSDATIHQQRRWYDEFILHVDDQFAKLYAYLEENGKLENTWLILTSDHGEMFERGILAHNQPVYHRPIINVPLMIFPPGQSQRVDIFEATSAIDLLPTLAHIAEQPRPDWSEGRVMSPFATGNLETRDLTTIHVQERQSNGAVSAATAMLIRDTYKLMWYFGYEQLETGEFIELYDTASDPEEIHNLYPQEKARADEILTVLQAKLDALNAELVG